MRKVALRSYKPGLKKVSLTLLMRHTVGYSLKEAKNITDALLDRKPVMVEVPGDQLETVLGELTNLGVEFVRLD